MANLLCNITSWLLSGLNQKELMTQTSLYPARIGVGETIDFSCITNTTGCFQPWTEAYTNRCSGYWQQNFAEKRFVGRPWGLYAAVVYFEHLRFIAVSYYSWTQQSDFFSFETIMTKSTFTELSDIHLRPLTVSQKCISEAARTGPYVT